MVGLLFPAPLPAEAFVVDVRCRYPALDGGQLKTLTIIVANEANTITLDVRANGLGTRLQNLFRKKRTLRDFA